MKIWKVLSTFKISGFPQKYRKLSPILMELFIFKHKCNAQAKIFKCFHRYFRVTENWQRVTLSRRLIDRTCHKTFDCLEALPRYKPASCTQLLCIIQNMITKYPWHLNSSLSNSWAHLWMAKSRANAATVFSPPERLSIGRNRFPGATQL